MNSKKTRKGKDTKGKKIEDVCYKEMNCDLQQRYLQEFQHVSGIDLVCLEFVNAKKVVLE